MQPIAPAAGRDPCGVLVQATGEIAVYTDQRRAEGPATLAHMPSIQVWRVSLVSRRKFNKGAQHTALACFDGLRPRHRPGYLLQKLRALLAGLQTLSVRRVKTARQTR